MYNCWIKKKYYDFIGTYVVLHGKKKVQVVPLYRHMISVKYSLSLTLTEGIRF